MTKPKNKSSAQDQGKKQPKPKCPHCQAENQTSNNCTNCGTKLTVTCESCQATVKNTKFCRNCGAQLNQPATQQSTAKKTEKWLITAHEPDGPGSDGKYLIPIQVTCNGKGVKSKLCILVGNNALDGKKTHATDKDGFLLVKVEIKTKRAQLYINLEGFTAETEKRVWLYGKKPKITGNGFWIDFWNRVNFNTK